MYQFNINIINIILLLKRNCKKKHVVQVCDTNGFLQYIIWMGPAIRLF